jgi:hypothetical protein
MEAIGKAEEPIRRAVASAVAARALKVSALASIGGFGIMSAVVFYACGWNSFENAFNNTRDWAHVKRDSLDRWLGVQDRIDRQHAEVLATQGMSDEEELAYISKRYMPDEDWEADLPKKGKTVV